MYYILDTNIWIDVGQRLLPCSKLKKPGVEVALAPLMIIELVRGVVRGGEARFPKNKALFECLADVGSSVMELPRVAMFAKLWNVNQGISGVRPKHYMEMSNLDAIHEGVLDKELNALNPLAKRASIKTLHLHMARGYKLSGLLPDPELFAVTFSAAIEFLKYWVRQVRNGANPAKKQSWNVC
jgi:hypothetical protein